MAAQSVLVKAALAIPTHANVNLDGQIYPLSLYLTQRAAAHQESCGVVPNRNFKGFHTERLHDVTRAADDARNPRLLELTRLGAIGGT